MPDNQVNSVADVAEINEAIESQNIFEMLGIAGLGEVEQNDFLDRLQKTIWDDFLDNDVELLLTDDEVQGLIEIINRGEIGEDEKQGLMLEFLQKLIPDLEEILLEKASKLKKDLMMERIVSLEEIFSGDEAKMSKLGECKDLAAQEKWHSLTVVLNEV